MSIASTGYVGIGTTGPSALLDVGASGDSNTGKLPGIVWLREFQTGGIAYLDARDGTANSIDLQIRTQTAAGALTSSMYFKNDGNIGIGTTSPATLLEIMNASAINDTATTLVRVKAGADGTLGPLVFKTTLYPSATSGSRYLALEAVDNTGFRNLVLNPSGGNIGIGTTSPGAKLELYGIDQTLKITQNPGAAGDSSLWLTSAGATNFVDLNLNGGHIFKRSDNGAKYIYFGPDTTLANAKMAIDFNGGNVGIGTTGPTRPLDVIKSGVGSTAYIGSTDDGLLFQNASGLGTIIGVNSAANSYNDIEIRAAAVGSGLYISTTGNVGISATTPEQKLEVGGNIIASSSGNVDLILNATNATSTDGKFILRSAGTSDRLDILSNSTVRMSIASTGYVGIGTTNPGTYKLYVNGTGFFATSITAPVIKLTTGATDGYFLQSDAAGNGTWAAIAASQV